MVLFDEIEKAHPDIFNVLLEILDDGRMTDGQGRTVDFKNTIIIMTSNVGSQLIQSDAATPEKMKDAVLEALRASFKPEFLNRIDETIIFHHLTPAMLQEIVHIQMQTLMRRLADQHIDLTLSADVSAFLAEKGYDEVYGARPLKRAIQKYIENPLSMEILEGNVHEGMAIRAELAGETVRFARHAD